MDKQQFLVLIFAVLLSKKCNVVDRGHCGIVVQWRDGLRRIHDDDDDAACNPVAMLWLCVCV